MADTTSFFYMLCNNSTAQGLVQWLIAIGTIGAVIVATCGPMIKKLWNQPKIIFFTQKKAPFVEIKSISVDSSNEEDSIEIRVGLKNKGRKNACSVNVYIDCYYKKASDDFIENLLTPISLKNYDGNKIVNVVPQRLLYLPILTIRNINANKTENVSSDNNQTKNQLEYGCFLPDGKKLGKGDFIIPIYFTSSNTFSKTYIKIYWNTDSLDIQANDFIIKTISEKEFISLTKNRG